ncbi:MAG TPA: hypothetical protein VFA98_08225 [Thermoanaerobaculia bacterium]|jgi:hypothetical protein|nr:hypothetical protein [Thermoanaerobaculia bacterium]
MRRVHKWIKKSGVPKHKGALHRTLGYGKHEHIPTSVLVAHSHGGGKTAHRSRWALLARGYYGHGFKHRRAHHGRAR